MLRNLRMNPKLNFKQAWTKARVEKKALLSPDGRVLEPVLVDDDYGPAMSVAYYDTGRLASGSFDGNWEVVPAPRMNPHPPAEFPKYGLLDLSSLEGESKGHMSWAALQNVMKHQANIGYSIVVKTGSDRNVHDLGTLRSAFDDIAFQLVRGQPVVIHFEPGFGELRPGYSLRVRP